MTEPRTERFLEYPPQKGGLVELKDGRLMGIIRGMLKFYSEDRGMTWSCLLYTSPSPRDGLLSRMPSSA